MTVSDLIRELRKRVLEDPKVAEQKVVSTSWDSGPDREDKTYEIGSITRERGKVRLG